MEHTKKGNKLTYHDYVIKDGRFIGRFDEMYSKFEDPWMQSSQPNKYARTAGLLHIEKFNIESILECGSGLGYYSNWIWKQTGIIPSGIDISTVAIQKARQTFPNLDFQVANVRDHLLVCGPKDCILFAEIVWYILDDLLAIFETLHALFKDKYLLVNQVFYKGTQKYGTEYFTSVEQFIDFVPFTLEGSCVATTTEDTTIEASLIFRI